jgi:hypothetical protein
MGNVLSSLAQSMGPTVSERVAVAVLTLEAVLMSQSLVALLGAQVANFGWMMVRLALLLAAMVVSVVALALPPSPEKSELLAFHVAILFMIAIVWLVLQVVQTVRLRPLVLGNRQHW